MPESLFRKVAIERQSSPEKLDVLMQITSPKGWLSLLSLGGLLLGALSWGFMGRIPVEVTGQGILMPTEGVAVVFFTAGTAGKLREGMVAEIAPLAVERSEFGFLRGRVAHVSEYPSSRQDMMRKLQNEVLVQELSRDSSSIEVSIALIPDPAAPSGYAWSSSKGPEMKLHTGVRVVVSVTIEKRRPITLLIPFMKKTILGGY